MKTIKNSIIVTAYLFVATFVFLPILLLTYPFHLLYLQLIKLINKFKIKFLNAKKELKKCKQNQTT